MYGIGLHALLGADEVRGDVVAGEYHTCWTLDMPLTVAVVKSVPQFWFLFYLFFRAGLPLFPICPSDI
jgi:hypothetical protein